MTQADFYGEMVRLRDHAVAQRDAIETVIEAIDQALPVFGKPEPVREDVAAPPRPQPPAPRATSEAGRHDDKVLHALRNGPLNPKTIGQLTTLPKHAVKRTLAQLVTARKVVKTGSGPRNTVYHVA